MNVAFLCLGGNMGDRLAFINNAKELINSLCGKITAESAIYETEAWGAENAPEHYNQCLKLETKLEAEALLKELLEIEIKLGRVRNELKNETRVIDIDILFYNKEIINKNNCEIPHPRLQLRQFVLKPLNEIAGDFVHPVLNKSISELLSECKDKCIAKKLTENVHLH